MKFINRFFKNTAHFKPIFKYIIVAGAIATSVLLIPLLAMVFTDQVNWNLDDFIVAWVLLFGTGFTYKFVTVKRSDKAYRIAAGIASVTALMIVWSNLAVGIIGSEDNPVNLLYFIVLLVGITGSLIARFKPSGMALTMYAMALTQFLVPVVALLIRMPDVSSGEAFSDIVKIFMINGFFVVLFIGSALLFKNADKVESGG